MDTFPQTQSELIEQLHQSWTKLEQTLAQLNDEQLTSQHDQVGWSIKDHLDHLSVWEEGIAALLECRPRYEAMGLDPVNLQNANEDQINAMIWERTKTRTLSETRTALRASREHLLRALDSLNDGDLSKGYSSYQPKEPSEDSGKPIMDWVVSNSSGHYLEHLPWIQAIVS